MKNVTGAESFLAALCRAKGEFLEMPGLSVTIAQAQRLWGVDRTMCEAILEALLTAGFLVTSGSAFRRPG